VSRYDDVKISAAGAGYYDAPAVHVPPRILIAGTSYVDNEYTRELCQLWFRTLKHLNPNEDFILIDACSPFDPLVFLPKETNIFRFEENVGAITRGGGDGAGRGCAKAMELAIEGGYDYVCVYESDFIMAQAIRPIINRMHKAGVKVAVPSLATPYQFCEWGCCFFNVQYLKDTKFIERYDWKNTPKWPLVEMRLEKMFGDDLFLLNIQGFRNESNQLNVANIANNFPYGVCRWLTHCADPNLYVRMLELNNVYPL
jgi:hypothetical protein